MALIDQAAAAQANSSAGVAAVPPDPNAGSGGAGAPDDQGGDAQGSPMSEQDIAALQQAIEAKIPPEQQDAYQRVLVAGKKVLYSKDTSPMLMEEIQSDEPADKKLAGAAGGLMSLLDRESKNTIPPAIYVPAGASLLLDIADVMVKGGQAVTNQNVRDGLDQFSALVMAHHGASPDQVTQTVGGAAPAPDASSQGDAPAMPQPPMPGGPQ